MSTIKVNKIENTSTTNGGISIDNSGHVTVDGQKLPSAGPLSNRNLVINGAMQVSQRSTSETGVTNAGYKTIDRYRWGLVDLGTWTLEQSTDAPDGFNKSFKATCTTADASPAAADLLYLQYRMEAQDLQHLNFGTSAAVPMTLSFWVKSNKTGSASFMMYQNDNSNRLFSTSYTISSANTWEYKTIAIPADTSGLINDDTGIGLTMGWWLNSGSDSTGGSYNTTWGTYAAANTNVNNLGVGGATNDNWLITGIQLEVGSVATPFEHRSYGDELARCQRYFQGVDTRNDAADYQSFGVGMWVSASRAYCEMTFQTEMRAPPTSVEVSAANTWYVNTGSTAITGFTSAAINVRGRNSAILRLDGASNGVNGRVGRWLSNNNNTAYCFFSAEL